VTAVTEFVLFIWRDWRDFCDNMTIIPFFMDMEAL